jgi:hydrogenase expression/formation protein HypC
VTNPPSFADATWSIALDAGDACADGCITCGDVAVEVTILRLLPAAMAVVDTGAGEEEVSIALVDAVVGDTILVHASEAIAVLRG